MCTDLTAGVKDINHFRMPYHILVNEGAGVTGFSPNGLNMLTETKNCQFTVVAPIAGSATPNAVTCAIRNLPYLQGQSLSLDYLADGKWHCNASTGISKSYLPQDCQ